MMKYILLLLLMLALLASPASAGRGQPNFHAKPHATACVSEYMSASLSGAAIEATLPPGGEVTGFVTYYNRTEGQQWIVTSVEYVTDQEQLELPAKWVTFSPAKFCLEAGEVQVIEITIKVPRRASAGEYRALLHFAVSPQGGGVGVAVAIWAKIAVE